MSDKYVLGEDGRTPVLEPDLAVWGKSFGDSEKRRVARTKLPNGVEVSTVFLGLDHSFGGDKPLLFETLIFGGKDDGEGERYSTWDEAEAGHERYVAMARA